MASKPAVALIVAGSGSVSDAEVFDLLEDAYPEDQYSEVGLIVPVDKDLYTDAVKFAVEWFNDNEGVIPVRTKGATLSRASTKIGAADSTQEVEKFEDILDVSEFEDWDEVHFLVAVPPDDDSDPNYDLYAELVEAAQENGLKVKDLTAGLDDVVLMDPEPEEAEEPQPEPEPEPEKPARKSRARKRETPEPDPVVAEQMEKITDEPEVADFKPSSASIQQALEALSEIARAMEKWDEAIGIFDGVDEVKYRPLTLKARRAFNALATNEGGEPTEAAPQDAEDKPKRGRGRPRTQFEVKQILDEDEDEWIPRPAGRLRKGTQWRTIHAETEEVLDEGTAN